MVDHQSIRRIFEDALHLDPAERERFLDRICTDGDTRTAVMRLLAADERAGPLDSDLTRDGLLQLLRDETIETNSQSATQDSVPASMETSLIGHSIARYRIVRLIARGGMGEVYEAEQSSPKRRVALKVLRSGTLAPGAISRFNLEAEILARLEHPNIARLYDAGTVDLGHGAMPWIAMELVPNGMAITEYAEQAELPLDDRLRLFAVVCDAVHHGHRKGFIHRDLKPNNILVGADGTPSVIDFGVARAVASDISIATSHTLVGQLVGSLRYMSPEQCAGKPDGVDVRSDVYALGIVMYELLTGAMPYDLGHTTNIFQAPRIICESLPRRPSIVAPQLRGDVETIILRCLEKDPDRRYEGANAIARDIRHHLAQEPIEARSDRTMYVLRRVLHRHRPAVAVAIGFVVLIAAALVAVSIFWQRAENQRFLAETRTEALRHENYIGTVALARAAYNEDNVTGMTALLETCPEDLRHWEWWHLHALADDCIDIHDTASLARPASPRYSFTTPLEGIRDFGFAVLPKGDRAAIVGADGRVHLWDIQKKLLLRTFEGLNHAASAVALSADGRRVAAREARPSTEKSAFAIWNIEDGQMLARGEAHDMFGGIALSPDGRQCAIGSDNVVLLHDVDEDRALGQFVGRGQRIGGVVFSNDGAFVAASGAWLFALWAVESYELLWQESPPKSESGPIAFSPDDAMLAIARRDGVVNIMAAEDGHILQSINRPVGQVWGIAFSSDGTRLATSYSSAVEVWDTRTGSNLARLHTGVLFRTGLCFGIESNTLLVGCFDGRMREFDTLENRTAIEIDTDAALIDAIAASPIGDHIAFAGRNRTIGLLAAENKTPLTSWPAHQSAYRMYDLAFDPTGTLLASGGEDRMIRVWSVPDGRALEALGPAPAPIIDVEWTSDGTHILGATREGRIEVWNYTMRRWVESFQPGEPMPLQPDWWTSRSPRVIAISSRRNIIATSGHEKVIRLWSWPQWTPAGELTGHTALVRDLEFDRSGRRLVSAAQDGTVRIWDVADARLIHTLVGNIESAFTGVAISPDGKRVASTHGDQWVRVWDMQTGRLLITLPAREDNYVAVTFTGDSRRIVASDNKARLTVFEAPGYESAPPASPILSQSAPPANNR